MPLISPSTFRPPLWLRGGHAQTIHPALFRKVRTVTQRRERIETEDGDFLELEWAGAGSNRLAILSHGLESRSRATYVQGMATALLKRGWDVLAWSFRGCSGEPNRLACFYHSGATWDLDAVVRHALEKHPADRIDLIGFSLGGNLNLKYIGERGADLYPRLGKAVAFSVPCELACSSAKLAEWQNRIYMQRFLKSLRRKVIAKHKRYPTLVDITGVSAIRSFAQFDDRFTAPLHGFKDAADYWKRSSCRQFLPDIRIPTLLVSALNDPILGPDCYPWEEAKESAYLHLEAPAEGGHIGFGSGREYWSETRALEFLSER